jgi:hypothetical protein
MEIEAEMIRKFMLKTFENFKMLETEILALKLLYARAQQWETPELVAAHAREMESELTVIRSSPQVKASIDQKFAPSIEMLNRAMDSKAVEDAATEFLKNWKPSGQGN